MLAEPKDSSMGHGHLAGGETLRAGATEAGARGNDGPEMGAGRKEVKRLEESSEREPAGDWYFGERSRFATPCLILVLGFNPCNPLQRFAAVATH